MHTHKDRKDGQSIGFSVYVSIGMRCRIATFDSVKNHLVNYSYIYIMKNFYLTKVFTYSTDGLRNIKSN